MLQADFLRPDTMPIRLEQMLFLLMKVTTTARFTSSWEKSNIARP